MHMFCPISQKWLVGIDSDFQGLYLGGSGPFGNKTDQFEIGDICPLTWNEHAMFRLSYFGLNIYLILHAYVLPHISEVAGRN